MKKYIFFVFFFTAVRSQEISAPSVLTATTKSTVIVRCQYDQYYKHSTKYWCRGKVYELCRIVVKTTGPQMWERTTISDDTQNGIFSVTVSDVRPEDKGQYWCVISRFGRNVLTGVFLQVDRPGLSFITPVNTATSWPREGGTMPEGWAVLRWMLFGFLIACFVIVNVRKNLLELAAAVFAAGRLRSN